MPSGFLLVGSVRSHGSHGSLKSHGSHGSHGSHAFHHRIYYLAVTEFERESILGKCASFQ